jgi:hypothetical protein
MTKQISKRNENRKKAAVNVTAVNDILVLVCDSDEDEDLLDEDESSRPKPKPMPNPCLILARR